MITIGNTNITKAYLGQTELKNIAIGNELLLSSEPAPLPYDAEVEYLESTGTQWIDTGINADSALFYEIKVQATTTSTQRMGALTINPSVKRHHFSIPESSTKLVSFGYGTNAPVNNVTYNTNPHTFSLRNKTAKVDGSIVTTFNNTFDCGINFYLFARNGSTILPASARVYWCKLYNLDSLIRDYIPVRIGTTGYMYDKISGTLFGNDGTGVFILGNDV